MMFFTNLLLIRMKWFVLPVYPETVKNYYQPSALLHYQQATVVLQETAVLIIPEAVLPVFAD